MSFFGTIRDALALPAAAAAMPAAADSGGHLMPISVDPKIRLDGLTRDAAMKVPAVARCRRLIVGSIARCPLVATKAGEVLPEQPAWLTRTDTNISPYHRMAWTVDDLLFHGWSLWAVKRGAAGQVTHCQRVPWEYWDFNEHGQVSYQGRLVDPREVCLIPSLDEGVLTTARGAINHARQLNDAAARAALTPAAHLELHQTGGPEFSDEKINALMQQWVEARRGERAGVAFTNPSVEVREHGSFDTHLLVEGRNAASLDVARAMGIPAQMIDATSANATMTYQNGEVRNAEFVDYCLSPIMAAIVARLGLDDMCAHGTAVAFDTSELTGQLDHTVNTPDDKHTADAKEELD